MTKTTVTKLLTAAATVATSSLVASTVAIETAKAATFTLTSDLADKYGEWELNAPGAESVEDLFAQIQEIGSGVESAQSWSASYYEEELELGESAGFWFLSDSDRLLGLDAINLEDAIWVLDYADQTRREWGLGAGSIYIGLFNHSAGRFFHSSSPSDWVVVAGLKVKSVPEPSSAIALGLLGAGLVASRRRRRSK